MREARGRKEGRKEEREEGREGGSEIFTSVPISSVWEKYFIYHLKNDHSVKLFPTPWNFKLNSPISWVLLFTALSLSNQNATYEKIAPVWIISLAFCLWLYQIWVSLFLSPSQFSPFLVFLSFCSVIQIFTQWVKKTFW